MSNFIERIIRRREKYSIVSTQQPTIPALGTNHVDDVFLTNDIYPGEIFLNLTDGKIYTSDGLQNTLLNGVY